MGKGTTVEIIWFKTFSLQYSKKYSMWSRGVFYDVKHCGLQSRLHGSPLLRKGKVWKVWWVSPQVKLETKAGPTSGLCTKTKCSLRGEKRGWGESDGNAVWCIHGWEFEVDEFSWSSHKITKKGGNMDKTRNISCLCTILPRVTWGCFSCTHWARIWERERGFI